jgi:hypothetical protein
MKARLETVLSVVLEAARQCLITVCLTSARITVISHNENQLSARV